LLIVEVKGLVAGTVNTLLALVSGQPWPTPGTIALGLALGAVSYGTSLVLFILAMRELAPRERRVLRDGAISSAPPAAFLLGESPTASLIAAAALMAAATWLLVRERHSHRHRHAASTHSHLHVHDVHHQHAHDDVERPEPHSHPHRPARWSTSTLIPPTSTTITATAEGGIPHRRGGYTRGARPTQGRGEDAHARRSPESAASASSWPPSPPCRRPSSSPSPRSGSAELSHA